MYPGKIIWIHSVTIFIDLFVFPQESADEARSPEQGLKLMSISGKEFNILCPNPHKDCTGKERRYLTWPLGRVADSDLLLCEYLSD